MIYLQPIRDSAKTSWGKVVSIIPGKGEKGILSLLINLRKRSKVKG